LLHRLYLRLFGDRCVHPQVGVEAEVLPRRQRRDEQVFLRAEGGRQGGSGGGCNSVGMVLPSFLPCFGPHREDTTRPGTTWLPPSTQTGVPSNKKEMYVSWYFGPRGFVRLVGRFNLAPGERLQSYLGEAPSRAAGQGRPLPASKSATVHLLHKSRREADAVHVGRLSIVKHGTPAMEQRSSKKHPNTEEVDRNGQTLPTPFSSLGPPSTVATTQEDLPAQADIQGQPNRLQKQDEGNHSTLEFAGGTRRSGCLVHRGMLFDATKGKKEAK